MDRSGFSDRPASRNRPFSSKGSPPPANTVLVKRGGPRARAKIWMAAENTCTSFSPPAAPRARPSPRAPRCSRPPCEMLRRCGKRAFLRRIGGESRPGLMASGANGIGGRTYPPTGSAPETTLGPANSPSVTARTHEGVVGEQRPRTFTGALHTRTMPL